MDILESDKVSPCRDCNMHKNYFPQCLEGCSEIEQYQKRNIMSYQHHLTYENGVEIRIE